MALYNRRHRWVFHHRPTAAAPWVPSMAMGARKRGGSRGIRAGMEGIAEAAQPSRCAAARRGTAMTGARARRTPPRRASHRAHCHWRWALLSGAWGRWWPWRGLAPAAAAAGKFFRRCAHTKSEILNPNLGPNAGNHVEPEEGIRNRAYLHAREAHLPSKSGTTKQSLNGSWCQHPETRPGFGRFPPRFSGYTSENPFDLLSATFIIPRPTEKRKVEKRSLAQTFVQHPPPIPNTQQTAVLRPRAPRVSSRPPRACEFASLHIMKSCAYTSRLQQCPWSRARRGGRPPKLAWAP